MHNTTLLEGPNQSKAKLIRYLNDKTACELNPLSSSVFVTPLSFYDHAASVCVIDQSHDTPIAVRFLVSDKNAYMIDGSNEVIYEANKTFGLKVTEKNLSDYINFFFMSVTGRHGRFLLINNVDELVLEDPKAKLPASVKQIYNQVDQTKIKKTKSGFEFTRVLLFADSLFSAKITVTQFGHIEMYDEELLVDDFGVLEDDWVFDVPDYQEEDLADTAETKNWSEIV